LLNLVVTVLSLTLCLYVPGLIWLIAIAVIVWRQSLKDILTDYSTKTKGLALLALMILLLPLIYGFIKDPALVKAWLLIPSQLPQAIDSLKSIAWMFIGIFVRLPYETELSVDRLPLLN